MIIKYARIAEKGYVVIKTTALAFIIIFIIGMGVSTYKNAKHNQYLSELDQTATDVMQDVEMQILKLAENTSDDDIEQINQVLEQIDDVEVVTNKQDNIIFIELKNVNDELWDMEVNWQYGTNNMSVVVYDPTRTYMWSNHFPKERFEVY